MTRVDGLSVLLLLLILSVGVLCCLLSLLLSAVRRAVTVTLETRGRADLLLYRLDAAVEMLRQATPRRRPEVVHDVEDEVDVDESTAVRPDLGVFEDRQRRG